MLPIEIKKLQIADKIALIVVIGLLSLAFYSGNQKKTAFTTAFQLNSLVEIIESDYKTIDSFEGLHMQGITDTGIFSDSDNPYNNRFDHPEGGSIFVDIIDYKAEADAVMFTYKDYPKELCASFITSTKNSFQEIYIEKTKVKEIGVPMAELEINEICHVNANQENGKVNIHFILEKPQSKELRPHIINVNL